MIDLHPTLQAEIDTGNVSQMIELLRIDKPGGGIERRTNAVHDVIKLGATWVSDGLWIGISPITTDGTNVDNVWTIQLDMTNTGIVNADYEGGEVRYYVAFLRSDGAVFSDPVLMGFGANISLGPDEETEKWVPTRTLEVHSLLWADQYEATQNARTNRTQQERYSGDRIFKDTALLRRTEFRLGGKGVKIWR